MEDNNTDAGKKVHIEKTTSPKLFLDQIYSIYKL